MKKKFLVNLSLLVFVGMLFFSCSDKDPTVATYTVTFETNGGTTIEPQEVEEGKTVIMPDNPTKSGFFFDGWFTDIELTKEFNPETEITCDITLYTKWTVTITYYTVTFETNGGTEIEPIKVEKGKTITMPSEPTKDGFAFAGWYKDENFQTEFNSKGAIVADIKIYAKWNEKKTLANGNVEITEEKKDASGKVVETVKTTTDKNGNIVSTTTVKKDDKGTTSSTTVAADGSKTIKDEYSSGIVVDTSVSKDGKLTSASAKDKNGKDVKLNEYELIYNQYGPCYEISLKLSDFFQNEDIVKGDVIKISFVGVSKEKLNSLSIQAAAVGEVDGWWAGLTGDETGVIPIFKDLSEIGDTVAITCEIPVKIMAKSGPLSDYIIQVYSDLFDGESEKSHKQSETLLGNISVTLDKTNRIPPVNITFIDGSNKETIPVYPGRPILKEATSGIDNGICEGWKNNKGEIIKYCPEESCTLTSSWITEFVSKEGRLKIKCNAAEKVFEITVKELPTDGKASYLTHLVIEEIGLTNLAVQNTDPFSDPVRNLYSSDLSEEINYTFKFPFAEKGKLMKFNLVYGNSVVPYHTETVEIVSPFTGLDYKDYIETDKIKDAYIVCGDTKEYNFSFNKNISPYIHEDKMNLAYISYNVMGGDVWWSGPTSYVTSGSCIIKDTFDKVVENNINGFSIDYSSVSETYSVENDYNDSSKPTWYVNAPVIFLIEGYPKTLFRTVNVFTPEYGSESASYYYYHPEELTNNPPSPTPRNPITGTIVRDETTNAECTIYQDCGDYFEFDFDDGAYFKIDFDGSILDSTNSMEVDIKNFTKRGPHIGFDLKDSEFSDEYCHYEVYYSFTPICTAQVYRGSVYNVDGIIYDDYFEFDLEDGAYFEITYEGVIQYSTESYQLQGYEDTFGAGIKNFTITGTPKDALLNGIHIEFDLLDGEYSEDFCHYVVDSH